MNISAYNSDNVRIASQLGGGTRYTQADAYVLIAKFDGFVTVYGAINSANNNGKVKFYAECDLYINDVFYAQGRTTADFTSTSTTLNIVKA